MPQLSPKTLLICGKSMSSPPAPADTPSALRDLHTFLHQREATVAPAGSSPSNSPDRPHGCRGHELCSASTYSQISSPYSCGQLPNPRVSEDEQPWKPLCGWEKVLVPQCACLLGLGNTVTPKPELCGSPTPVSEAWAGPGSRPRLLRHTSAPELPAPRS